MGISNEARRFLKAATILRTGTDHIFTPTYFAICQSIELSAKAFLRGSGYTEASLRKIGHNLVDCIAEAQKVDLDMYCKLSDEEGAAISQINPYYKGKDLQYSKSGFKSYPHVDVLMSFGERLWKGTRKFCEQNHAFHEGKASAVS